MGWGIFGKLRCNLEQAGKELPDKWRDGHDLKYLLLDAVKCAFAIFFFQHPLPDELSTTDAEETEAE
jgi:hypothetical protein